MKNAMGMKRVCAVRYIFQISQRWVFLHSIFVIYFHGRRTWPKKNLCHQNVHHIDFALAIFAKTYLRISMGTGLWHQYSIWETQRCPFITIAQCLNHGRLSYIKSFCDHAKIFTSFSHLPHLLKHCHTYLACWSNAPYIAQITDFIKSFKEMNWFPGLYLHIWEYSTIG